MNGRAMDPERRDYASMADFADPDGNTGVIHEIGYSPDVSNQVMR